jgi:hypothetical protein
MGDLVDGFKRWAQQPNTPKIPDLARRRPRSRADQLADIAELPTLMGDQPEEAPTPKNRSQRRLVAKKKPKRT